MTDMLTLFMPWLLWMCALFFFDQHATLALLVFITAGILSNQLREFKRQAEKR